MISPYLSVYGHRVQMACHLACRSRRFTYLPFTYYRSYVSTCNRILYTEAKRDLAIRGIRTSDSPTPEPCVCHLNAAEFHSYHELCVKQQANKLKGHFTILLGCGIGTVLGLCLYNNLGGNNRKVVAASSNNNETNCKCVN